MIIFVIKEFYFKAKTDTCLVVTLMEESDHSAAKVTEAKSKKAKLLMIL